MFKQSFYFSFGKEYFWRKNVSRCLKRWSVSESSREYDGWRTFSYFKSMNFCRVILATCSREVLSWQHVAEKYEAKSWPKLNSGNNVNTSFFLRLKPFYKLHGQILKKKIIWNFQIKYFNWLWIFYITIIKTCQNRTDAVSSLIGEDFQNNLMQSIFTQW